MKISRGRMTFDKRLEQLGDLLKARDKLRKKHPELYPPEVHNFEE